MELTQKQKDDIVTKLLKEAFFYNEFTRQRRKEWADQCLTTILAIEYMLDIFRIEYSFRGDADNTYYSTLNIFDDTYNI